MQKKPRALGAARGEVGGPREEATQRCDSATPSFIPPLNKRAARKPPSRLRPTIQRRARAGGGAIGSKSAGRCLGGAENLTLLPVKLR